MATAVRLPSFWTKAVLAVGVVALADVALFEVIPGAGLGLLGLALVAAVVLAHPAARANRLSRVALALAAAFAALQIERATPVGWLLFLIAIAVAAFAPRAAARSDAWRWGQRLIVGGLKALAGPPYDLHRLLKVRSRSRPLKVTAVLLAGVLPVVGGGLFLGLFAGANPVIQQGLASLSLPAPDFARIVLWGVMAFAAWALLRPRGMRRPIRAPGIEGELNLPGVTTASITVSLVVFNALFALQNGLDVAYLWSGAGLPEGVTFADYAHRGAYGLLATAVLAGLFVLVFLRPGSETAATSLVRWLVVAWVAQTLFLVASTILRTLDYIDAYSLSRMRIAALLWMALVAVGLVLICWRLLAGKSSSWLINANVAAAGAILALCSVVDLGAVAASWNVRHAHEIDGTGAELDLPYLARLHGAGVVSLAELERRPLPPPLHCRVSYQRRLMTAQMAERQAEWVSWRWRDARRLAQVRTMTGEAPREPSWHELEVCSPPKPQPTSPLTPTANPRT